MTGKAAALAHGAATIVNAIALGKGAAFGVDLWTKAEVKLSDEPNIIIGEITSDPEESTVLIAKTVSRVFKQFNVEKRFGAKVKTWSNIPVARGLKSSSAAANAIALATVAALGKTIDDIEVINLGVDAAFNAKVTVTGAFDDACASYFGGAVVTDNLKRELLKRVALPDDLMVLFHVPSTKAYTVDSDVNRLRNLKPLVEVVYKEAIKGNFWASLSLNGIIYSTALGYNASVALDALAAGALASGLCGKGPSVAAVVSGDKIDSVRTALQSHNGEVMQARLNHEKAKVVS
ncbi:shikimate kinase [Candidatus Bathyarchaeota archaeon]|nr:shikimate kinase [Candidatus Bathyarchaeota archaeon]